MGILKTIALSNPVILLPCLMVLLWTSLVGNLPGMHSAEYIISASEHLRQKAGCLTVHKVNPDLSLWFLRWLLMPIQNFNNSITITLIYYAFTHYDYGRMYAPCITRECTR